MDCKEAMDVVTKALREDPGYYIGWQANIAMAFIDEYKRRLGMERTTEILHEIANQAAKNFLDLLKKD